MTQNAMSDLDILLRDWHELEVIFRYYRNNNSLFIHGQQKSALEGLISLKPYFRSGNMRCWESRSRDRWVTYIKEKNGMVLQSASNNWQEIHDQIDFTDIIEREALVDEKDLEYWDEVARERYGMEGLQSYLENGYFWKEEK
ncbi:MAG: hypothetical protein HN590_06350 [Calditrichaeota bacterium]|jgi:hypothetical protein|nr:hypothetical protein [Calditrichota bacterium]